MWGQVIVFLVTGKYQVLHLSSELRPKSRQMRPKSSPKLEFCVLKQVIMRSLRDVTPFSKQKLIIIH